MATHLMCIIFLLAVVSASENYYRNEGFMHHLNTGMKLAQNLLGSESVALKVADFVVRAFNTVNMPSSPSASSKRQRPTHGNHDESEANEVHSFQGERPVFNAHDAFPTTPWRYLVRLLGLQPNQLSAVAVNVLVLVAQMVTSFLADPRRPSQPHRSDEPTDWILNKNSKKLQNIIAAAKNESLTDLLAELVTEAGSREETSCIRLLVCKITPFVSKMQMTVFGKGNVNSFDKDIRGAAVLYRHLPSSEDIRDTSDSCEKRFPDCDLKE